MLASIAELWDLSHLQGALHFELAECRECNGCFRGSFNGKERLDDLVFAWDSNNVVDADLINQTKVLEKLQPHTKMKRLSIQHYNGNQFPKWLGDPSFMMNLVVLRLEDCESCTSLPPLGKLQSLKDLQIVKKNEVQKVGAELYGSSSMKPFGSLEILRFEEMWKWEEWVCCGVEFPCLKKLYIQICPKLIGDIPKCLPQSTKIVISECRLLMCCLPVATSIHELRLDGCEDMVVRSVGGLVSLASFNMWSVCKIPPILPNLTSLKYLKIEGCKSLVSFSELALPPMHEKLRIGFCPILESLPVGMMQNDTTLQCLNI